jgi:hypothetical protein
VSGVKRKVVSEVMRKYDECGKYDDVSDTTMTKHKSTNLEAEISCAYIRPKKET